MTRKFRPFRHIRLVYCRSSTLIKCVVLVTILLSTAALVILRFSLQDGRAQQAALQQQAAQLEQDNRTLTAYIAELGTAQSIKRIATLELGLVDPDSQFFTPSSDSIPE